MLMLWGLVGGSLASVVAGTPLILPAVVATTAGISSLPILTRLRRVLRQGYTVDDLHAALREQALVRSEELRYERQFSSVPLSPALRVTLVVSSSSWVAQSWITSHAGSTTTLSIPFLRTALALSAGFAVISTVGLAGQFVLQRLAAPLTELKINFWKGKWGARLAALAGIGLERAERPALAARMLTEVALGRATDHLFHALPRALRKELAALPDAVHRLERAATQLRASIDSHDEHLAMFERSGRRDESVERELHEARDVATERLAQTIAALENIRLDLLRLQMGSTGVESVTASLAAAQRVGEQIRFAVEAQDEVERLLSAEPPRPLEPRPPVVEHSDEDDDADTPVDGVPTARG
jgi:hypothetical protein